MKKLLFTLCLLLGATTLSAQSHHPSDIRPQTSDRMAAYREAIGLDMTVPDFSTKKIDAKVMGTRLANILRYLEDNIDQGQYNHWMASVYREQNESHKNVYFVIKKIKLQSITKSGNDIDICYKIWPDENSVQIKQAVISLHFKDGVSESKATNELFSNISHYVQAREKMNQ